MRFAGRLALVTGGGSGIGRACAVRLAEEGAGVVLVDQALEGARETAGMVERLGRRALAIQADVSRPSEVRQSIESAVADLGALDILVNSAGINIYRDPLDFTDDEWQRVIDVDLSGVWWYCRYTAPHMVARGKGAIINIASVGALVTSYERAPYMASKGGVVSLTRALALDLADRNIRVNAVAPGPTETGMSAKWRYQEGQYEQVQFLVPMRRWAQPEEIASAVAFLASDDASYVTGHTLVVDGGMSVGNQLGRPWSASVRVLSRKETLG